MTVRPNLRQYNIKTAVLHTSFFPPEIPRSSFIYATRSDIAVPYSRNRLRIERVIVASTPLLFSVLTSKFFPSCNPVFWFVSQKQGVATWISVLFL